MVIEFGSGVIYGLPATTGNPPANPTPFRFGVVQEASVDFKADLKKLYGQNQFPVATARGKFDVSFKAKIAVADIQMLNQLYFAQSYTMGVKLIADSEAGTIPGSPFQITVANSATFDTDYGVVYSATGQPLIKVAAGPITGQYTVNVATGKYTFAAVDNTLGVLISYTYTQNARGGTVTINNQLMGYAPEVQILLYNMFRNKYLALQLNDVTLGMINIPTKLEDFWILETDGSANADATGQIGKLMADLV